MNIYQNVVPINGTEEGRKGLDTIQNSHSSPQRNSDWKSFQTFLKRKYKRRIK